MPQVPRLTREHIIPEGLGGQLLFHKASCDDCAKIINEEVENLCLGAMVGPRTKLNMKKRAPESLAHGVWRGSKGQFPLDMSEADFRWNELPTSDMPLAIILPTFVEPGILTGAAPSEGFIVNGLQSHFANKTLPTQDEGCVSGHVQKFSPDLFCRMIAKVAHGAATAELGKDAFSPFLPQIILGKNKNISFFVGGGGIKPMKTSQKHVISIKLRSGYVIADVQLFANLRFRAYRAVVGLAGCALRKWHLGGPMRMNAS